MCLVRTVRWAATLFFWETETETIFFVPGFFSKTVYIQTKETGNPHVKMYLPNATVSAKEVSFTNAAAAAAHPLAAEIFKIQGIVRVTLDVDNLKVEKAPSTEWKDIKVDLTTALYGYFESN